MPPLQTGLLYGVSFLKEDVISAAPHERLRSDAVAVAMSMCFEQQLQQQQQQKISPTYKSSSFSSSSSSSSTCCGSDFILSKDKICIVDPNVAFLMVSMNSIRLGPLDAMRKAELIFVPIANFDTTVPEGGYHWTLLVLQKEKVFLDSNRNSCCFYYWYPSIHVDSLLISHSNHESDRFQGSSSSSAYSHNQRFAQRAATLIISGLAAADDGDGDDNDRGDRDDIDDTDETEENEQHERIIIKTMTKAELNPNIKYHHASSSPRSLLFDPIVIPSAPQQKNSCDCGVFVALAVGSILKRMIEKRSSTSVFFVSPNEGGSERKFDSGMKIADWGYDQCSATKFKGDLFMFMSLALK